MISFGIKYWFAVLVVLLIATAGIVSLLYYKNKQNAELSRIQIFVLTVLRFLSVFGISVLILSPFIKSLKKNIETPLIITAWDNSGSLISDTDSAAVSQQYLSVKNAIDEKFGGKYKIINYTFGEKVISNAPITFGDKKSNYSELILNVADNHFNENIGALIIAGDGIYNKGRNPLNVTGGLNFPIYTLGFGDTTDLIDARIQNVINNRTTFSGNRFQVEVESQFSKLKGQPLKLSVNYLNNEIASEIVTPPNNNYFYSKQFVLDAGEAGLKSFVVNIETAENERNTKNNTSKFVINVLENKQKILILSDGPHPDIGAIKTTFDEQQTYDVTVFTHEPYPKNISDYNLLVLNQLPSASKSFSGLLNLAESKRIPVLFIVGSKTFIPQFNTLSQGAKINPLAGSGEEAQAIVNPDYAIFNLSPECKEMIPRFPPLVVNFADYELQAGFSNLLHQNIKNFATNKPLLATGVFKKRKTGFIFGEGLWRWRLFDYYQNQNHKHYNELVNQLVQYLALRENEDNFIINYQPVYAETENIIFGAEVYNEAYQKITSEEVSLKITGENGDEYDFTFDVQNQNYYLNAGNLTAGKYSFIARVKIGDETFEREGAFIVTLVNSENVLTRANHNLLFNLAEKTGGKFYLPNQVNQLVNQLNTNKKLKSTSYFQEMVTELLNLRWLFFVLLVLLSAEWFLRKYWGVY